MSELTITRGALKRIAREAMHGEKITPEQRAKLTETAKTAEAVVISGWRLRGCGCLVGSAYPELFRQDGKPSAELAHDKKLFEVGANFDEVLCDYLEKRGAEWHRKSIVKVIG